MTIGTLFIPAFESKAMGYCIKAALPFMDRFDAKLVISHVKERYPIGHAAEYYWHESAIKEFNEGRDRRAQEIRTTIDKAIGSREFHWEEIEGDEEVSYGELGRNADLIIAPSPQISDRRDTDHLIGNILTSSGRPVLILPENTNYHTPKSIVVGWNGSVEAARAISVAHPFLQAAESVTIIWVGEPYSTALYPQRVADALKRLGINAKAEVVKKNESTLDCLHEKAKKIGADTLLLGGYSHNRLRERIFGGVTQRVINTPPMPCILVH